ncbi:hypothetical protein [Haloglomus litoreum]|uniref:hypothetical protein n=1 Tax=Haloglomus litoreum TaxID=3034026 RepID=UPI0023E81A51|nr:hypothetical protein [Haloglomus sp. DT116]
MDYTRPLGVLVALGVALGVVGSLVSLVTGSLGGFRTAAAVVTIALVVVSVAAMVVVGTRGSAEWLENSGYW